MNAKVKGDSNAFEHFVTLFSSSNFQERLQNDVANPEGKDAKYVLNKLLPVLTTAGNHTTFGSLERNSAAGEMLAMIHCYGPIFCFLTVALDDVNNPHTF